MGDFTLSVDGHPVPNAGVIQTRVDQLAKLPKVTDASSYTQAASQRYGARVLLAEVDKTYDPLIASAMKLVTEIRTTKTKFVEPLQKVIRYIDTELELFEKEQQRQKALTESQLADEAEALTKEHREAEVKAMAKLGYLKESDNLAKEPLPPLVVPIVPTDVPTVPGLIKRTLWYAEVTDFKALVEAVAAGKAPLEALQPYMPVLNALAVASKSALNLPGVVAKSKSSRSQRT